MARPKLPWPPPKSQWPQGFSLHRDGWAKTYRGRTVVISGKRRTPRQVVEMFHAKCQQIDGNQSFIPAGPMTTLRMAASAYFAAMERRVANGRMSERQAENLIYEGRRFAKLIGGDRLVSTIGPNDFARAYAEFCTGLAPQTVASTTARVGTMFRWFVNNGIVNRVVYGEE